MTVTEFAILTLTHGLAQDSPTIPSTVIKKFTTARTVLEKASGYPFHYFQQVEDPSKVYIIGRWSSVAAHHAFLPSPENVGLLEALKDDVVIESDDGRGILLFHLDADIFELGGDGPGEELVFDAPVISCNRHSVPEQKKAGFERKFEEVRGLLEEFTKPYKVVGAWRIEKEKDEKGEQREEWVLFSGFQSVQQHWEFSKTEQFPKYREIVEFVDGFEVKHLRKIEGL